MMFKNFYMYFLIGAIVGVIVGLMKDTLGVWVIVGAGIGMLLGILIQRKIFREGIQPEKLMWFGFFLIFPILFFGNQLKGNVWYDVFGILAVVGSVIMLINFVKILKKGRVGGGKVGKKGVDGSGEKIGKKINEGKSGGKKK